MKEINQKIQKIAELWPIRKIEVIYRQTGVDTADTWVSLYGDKHVYDAKWDSIKEFLDVSIDYNSVARLKRQYSDEYKRWKKYKDDNAKEYAKYKELKEKFG